MTTENRSRTLCLSCAQKHISMARCVLTELMNGYNEPDHIAKAIGNFALAEEHVAHKPELMRRLRAFRIHWVERVFDGSGEDVDLSEEEVAGMYGAVADILTDIRDIRGQEGVLPAEEEQPVGKEDQPQA